MFIFEKNTIFHYAMKTSEQWWLTR